MMETAAGATGFESALEFLRLHPWLHGFLQLGLLAFVGFLIYRFLMSSYGGLIRRKIPFVKTWHAKRQVAALKKAGEYAQAGDHLLALHELDHAISVFLEGNLFGRAADVHLRKRQYDKAAMLYERAGEYRKAGEIYLDRKQNERAEANFEKVGRLEELAQLYRDRKDYQLAASVYLKMKKPLLAAEMLVAMDKNLEAAEALASAYEQARNAAPSSDKPPSTGALRSYATRAGSLFEKAGAFKRAAKMFLVGGQKQNSARCFESAGDYAEAAQQYESAGNLGKAATLRRQTGDDIAAARLEAEKLFSENDPLQAVAKFQEAEEFQKAAEIYRDLHELDKAAAMYEKGEEFFLAGSLYQDAGEYGKAGDMFDRSENYTEAVECYGLAKLPEKQARVLETVEDWVGLADNLRRRQLFDEALLILDNVGQQDPRFRSALSVKGKIFLEKGDPLSAKKFYEASVGMANHLTGADIDTIYDLAVVSDQTQSESSALELLEKMLAQDLVEDGAVEKANKVRKLLADRAYTRLSRMTRIPSGSRFFGESEKVIAEDDTAPKKSRYVKIKEIGRGGMGVVYTARDTVLDRIVALKVLSANFKKNEQAVKTFLREAKAAASLNHTNIVTVHDAGTQEGEYYIAMELIEGKTIKEILRRQRKLSYRSTLEVLRQLLQALEYAHLRNIVHRDLTTNNMMWTKQKSVKIMDFGLAKIVRELATEQSIVGGTPSFMSPEQTLGKPIDHRTDIYSLGICTYEMLLGELPFSKGDLGYHHLHTPPPVPRDKDPNLPKELNVMILRCMEKKPENRFQAVKEIRKLLSSNTT